MSDRAVWGELQRKIFHWCDEFFREKGRFPKPSEVAKGTGAAPSSAYGIVVKWRARKEATLQADKFANLNPDVFAISDLVSPVEGVLDLALEFIEAVDRVKGELEQLGELRQKLSAAKAEIGSKTRTCRANLEAALGAARATLDENENRREALQDEMTAMRDRLGQLELELQQTRADLEKTREDEAYWKISALEMEGKLNTAVDERKPRQEYTSTLSTPLEF